VEVYNALLKEYETLCGLECRAGRVRTHNGTVEQGPRLILHELLVVLAALTAHKERGVVVGHRHHTQHFARSRLNSNDGAALSYHERLGILLELDVEA